MERMSNRPTNERFTSESITSGIMPVMALLLFVYSILRAATLSFTHDESLSWLWYVNIPFRELLTNSIPSGNNHLLNTLGMRAASALFGDSELSLRLPALTGHLLWLVFTFLLLKNLTNPWVRLAGFMLLNVNPYLLDFFSLARGYSLSMGILAASLFWYFRWLKTLKYRELVPAVLALMLGTLANITMVTLFIAVWITSNLCNYKGLKALLIMNGIFATAALAVTGILFFIIQPLVKYDKIDYGGNTGFWVDSVVSLLNKSMYEMPYGQQATTIAAWFLIVAFFLTLLIFLMQARGRLLDRAYPLWVLSIMLILMATGTIMQFRLFGTLLLMSRTALIIWPLLVLIPIFLFDNLARHHHLSIPIIAISFILIAATGYHATQTLNLTHCLEWRFDADNKEMLRLLEKEVKPTPESHIRLANTWLMEPSLNFYRVSLPLPWLDSLDRNGPFTDAAFRYATRPDADALLKKNLPVIKHFIVSDNTLFGSR